MINPKQPVVTGGFRKRQGKKATTWTKSDKPNLLKNVKSGKFYGRFILAGKPKWTNLETTSHRVACHRLNDARQEIDRLRQARQDVVGGEATMGQLANLLLESLDERDDLKTKSKEAIQQAIAALRKTYPRFDSLAPTAIKKATVIAWRNSIRRDGTGYRSAFGKGGRIEHLDGSSTSLINKMISALKDMLAIAIERGQLVSNSLMQKGVRLPQKSKKPNLPEAEQIEKVFEEMEGNAWGNNLFPAELCRFIAYSGARKSEANRSRWRDVNWEKGFIRLHGTKTSNSDREVPLIPALRQHLQTLWERRQRMAVLQGGPNAKPSQNDTILKCKTALITLAT
ncbi:MAG: hypothetical protein EXS42_09095, partial [Lacunisphaera sp.]|nr:hypothetical protein [Lacunisphaera sp.]